MSTSTTAVCMRCRRTLAVAYMGTAYRDGIAIGTVCKGTLSPSCDALVADRQRHPSYYRSLTHAARQACKAKESA